MSFQCLISDLYGTSQTVHVFLQSFTFPEKNNKKKTNNHTHTKKNQQQQQQQQQILFKWSCGNRQEKGNTGTEIQSPLEVVLTKHFHLEITVEINTWGSGGSKLLQN